jgi:hypothetical protein
MLQEKCCRDITTHLHKQIAKSFLAEFASRVGHALKEDKLKEVP